MKTVVNKGYIRKTLFVILWIIIWQLCSQWLNMTLVLPGPVDVWKALKDLLTDKTTLGVVLLSTVNIMTGFILAMLVGCIAGIAGGKFVVIDELLSPVIFLCKTLPMASFIILILIIAGSKKVSAVTAFIVTIPIIYNSAKTGVLRTDQKLLSMARVFHIRWYNTWHYIYGKSILKEQKSGCKIAVGMAFKAGISAEVIGIAKKSIGEAMYLSKLYIATDELIAWSLLVVLTGLIMEFAVLQLLRLLEKI